MQKELPIGWVETKLGVIAEWGSGGTPNRSEPNYYNGTIPWVKTGDLNDSIILAASEYITELGLKKSSAKMFPKGSIIVAMYGATIGKTAKLGIDATTNQACAVAQASKIVVPEFLHYFLKAEKQEFIEKGKGGAQPNISQTVIKEHPFPLPPLPEQQRIVAKLDTLFGQIDIIKTHLERIPQLLKDFRQKVLTQAVTGKLTEEWKEGRELEEWKIENLKDLLEVGGIFDGPFGSNLKTKDYSVSGVRVIRLENIEHLRFIDDKETFISEEKYNSLLRHTVAENDLIFSSFISEEIRACILPELKTKAIAKADCFCIRPNTKKVNIKYLLFYLVSYSAYNQLISHIHGATRPRINTTQLKTLKVELPQLKEQQEIIRRVESLFAKADKIEASYQKLKEKTEQLPQAILSKAFRGELVEQLPIDGDARDLLEEFKKLKAEGNGAGKGKKLKPEEEMRMVAEAGVNYGKKNGDIISANNWF